MPSLENVLASVPGLGGYLAKKQMNEQGAMQEIQQAGGLVGLQQKLQAAQREKALRDEMAGLGADATHEDMARVASKYGSAGDILKVHQGAMDREQQRVIAREAAADRREREKTAIDLRYDQLAQRATDEADKRRLEERRQRDKAEADRRHDETLRLLGTMKAEAAKQKAPPGYRMKDDGTMEAIPGGPADTKLQGQFNQDTSALSSMTNDMDRLAAEANRLKTHPGLSKATGTMAAVPLVGGVATWPGTDAANFKAGLETLKSQVAFGVLQNMRNNSKTGGALGQVSDKEGALLAANLAALDRAQSPEEFTAALDRIVKYTGGAKDRLQSAYNLKHGDKGAAGAAAPSARPAASGAVPEYATEAEAAAAAAAGKIKPGDKIRVGGKSGAWK